MVRRVTTWSRRGWPPVTSPTFSSTTTARCCRRSSPPRISRRWTISLGRASSIQFFAESPRVRGQALRRSVRTEFGGGVLYNIPVYKKLVLPDPEDVGRVHGQQRKDQGRRQGATVEQTYGETWTSSCSCWATTTTSRRGADLRRGLHRDKANRDDPGRPRRVRAHAGGQGRRLLQQGFASAKLNDGHEGGRHRHRGALSAARRTANSIENVAPGKTNDVGFFALPGKDAATTA